MRRVSRELLTKEDIMSFTEAQLLEAKALIEAEIESINKREDVTTLVINNDVGGRRTPEIFRNRELKPHLHNLSLINEVLKNRQSVIDFMNTPDPDLDEPAEGPSQS